MSFNFLKHCSNCPSSTTHCCTKLGNIVLINNNERQQIQKHFDDLKSKLNIVDQTYTLFNEAKTESGVTPLNLIRTKDPDTDEDIDRCPFFLKPHCIIHTLGKPLDCKLWPISKFENSDLGLVYFDYNCTALKSRYEIPVSTVEESIALFNSLSDEQKSVYYNQSRKHYHLTSIHKEQWDEYQNYFLYKAKKATKCENKFKIFSKKYIDIFYSTSSTIKVSKWIIGIFFIMILTSMFNLVANNVSNYSHNEITFLLQANHLERFLILLFFPIIFILDAFRIIVPLPWITKYIDEKSKEIPGLKDEKKNLPKFQLMKLLVIGLLSFILLNILAIKFIYNPLWYFIIFSAVLVLDLFWYNYRANRKNVNKEIDRIKQYTIKQFDLIENKLNKLIPKKINKIAHSTEVLKAQLNELKDQKLSYMNELNNNAIIAENKEKVIQILEITVEEEYGYRLIVVLNLIICLIYPLLYLIHTEPFFNFRPFDILSEKFVVFFVYTLHALFIYIELNKFNFYLDELNYFYLKGE